MRNNPKTGAGDLIKIPYKEGWHTYARILIEGSYAIYDCPSTNDRDDYNAIIQSDILFIAGVNVFAIKDGNWTIVINIPFDDGDRLKNFYPRYFNPAPFNPVNKGFYEVYKNEIEDAIEKDWIKTGKIQLDGSHSNFHVESRINDYYDGKKNDYNRREILLFKQYLGLQ